MLAPARLQSAADTITTLSSRLTSSTLLEDRRAAILGLRSFAKDYPASVASEALRGLIGCLSKDGEDFDTVKLVLETLLMLFNPNENSPEASEQIALWLADEFTQRQDNITLLLSFLEANDFYPRLYSLQLLSAILALRTERTESCIFEAQLGISRLVAILDDQRDPIRNEGLSLLTYVTPNSVEIQKLAAFENAFGRIFHIVKTEGSLLDGGRVVEDCLILLANLLRLNLSNQSLFREDGFVPRLTILLNDAAREGLADNDAEWAKLQKNRNIYALLAVLRLFLIDGGIGTHANQASFWHHGVLVRVLELAFNRSTEMQIKAEALTTCADLIRGNQGIQEAFAQLQVTSVLNEPLGDGNGNLTTQNMIPKVFVIDGLLDLTLSVPQLAAFDSRLAACQCIKAYFFSHPGIRKHFLRRAIEGHASGIDETANVLTTILQSFDLHASGDPYRYWFAAVILFHLIYEDSTAKSLAMSVAEGDATSGEEVVTCIQTLTANLVTGIQKNADWRVLIAYLMLLCGWLFEDPDAVNDFLGEGSNLSSLVHATLQNSGDGSIVPGLCAMLLGIVYEFSTKDSPVPRSTIHPILASQLGRDQYIDRLTKLRAHPFLRDFEVLPQRLGSASAGGLPDVFFDRSFVDFVKDNFSRLLRAIDRDPGMEILVITNGVQKGISREMVDSLRSQLEEKDKVLQKVEEDLMSYQRQLGQEQADHCRVKETSALDLTRIKHVNQALQQHHEEDVNNLRLQQQQALQDHQRQLDHVQKTADANADRSRKRMEAEIAALQANVNKLEADLSKANKNHVQDLQIAHEEYTTKTNELLGQLRRAEDKASEFKVRADAAVEKVTKAEQGLADKEAEREKAQGELDDMLMVFGDLEEKCTQYKTQLIALGGNVSDVEEEEEEDGEEEDEQEEPDINQKAVSESGPKTKASKEEAQVSNGIETLKVADDDID
ncbi:p115 like vesicle tethering protein [Calycina marina]|uniref:P115 like vesicle tethering protein n=1 Tax=Calycina marina TaxID=1763456 RepID=A0A9P7YZX2_9HELO|nr:p115 like vesicle tethering protein [Calycina marina]